MRRTKAKVPMLKAMAIDEKQGASIIGLQIGRKKKDHVIDLSIEELRSNKGFIPS